MHAFSFNKSEIVIMKIFNKQLKNCKQCTVQVGVTRFNMDGSGSNYSVSTSNSPMMNRDVQQPFNQGEYGSWI